MPFAKPVLILDIDSDSSNSQDESNTPLQALRPAEQKDLEDQQNQIRQAEAEEEAEAEAEVMAEEAELQQIVKECKVLQGKSSEFRTRNAKISQGCIDLGKKRKQWKKAKKVVSSVATAKRETYDNTKFPALSGIGKDANDAMGMLRNGQAWIEAAKKPKPREE